MVTTAELNRRGLRYAVVVDGAATPASLADLDDKGLPYLVEVADGATMASRRALEARGLRYLVPVLVDATPASKASLAAQGLRYAVQVDADILPVDRAVLQRQGLACYVEVDSSGNSVAVGGGAAVGGAALLVGETDGFATDFTHPVDAERVALKSSGSTLAYAVNAFYANAGTSPKMVYDVAGTLGWSPHNLLLDSNGFVTGWTTGGFTMAKNATGPLGANTAWTLTMSAGSTAKWTYIDIANISYPYRYSVYAKAGTLNWIALGDGTALPGNAAFFNVSAGTVGTVAGRFSAAAITAVGNGFYRCEATVAGTAGFFDVQPHSADNQSASWAATGGETVIISAVQAERAGSAATTYLPTTTAARVGLALDYDPVTHAARGLLCEPQATNLLLRSGELDNATWSKGAATVTANATTAPDGSLTADKLVESATTAAHFTGQAFASTTGVASIFAKAGERTSFLFYDVTANKGNSFDLSAGTTGTAAGITTTGAAVIQSVGNGWYRCSIPVTASTSIQLFPMSAGAFNYAGNGTSGVYLWGAQLETGTVATSLIPTLAATVTRASDKVYITPASINYSATAGTWWTDVTPISMVGYAIIGCVNGSATPAYILSPTTLAMYDGTYTQKTVANSFAAHKTSGAFAAGDRAFTADGLTVQVDAGSATNLLNPGNIGFGCTPVGGEFTGNMYIRKLRYVPRRKTNLELVTETT